MLGIYSRISRLKEDGKDRSIKDQKLLGEEKAKELNLDFKHYMDEGISGAGDKLEERPAIMDLITDIISKKITAVFIMDESRLSRNPRTKYIITDIFKEYNVITYSYVDGVIDYSNPDDEFISEIKGVIHKRQITEQKIKIKSVLKRNAKEGRAHGILPYGYARDENRFIVIDESERIIVERIYSLSLQGVGLRKIAEIFNDESIPTRYNKIGKGTITTVDKNNGRIRITEKKDIKWVAKTIGGIIKNEFYKGIRNFSGQIYKSPIIIKPALWQKVNDNLEKNRNSSGKIVTHKYLLKGLIICGRCGRNYYGRQRVSLKDNYYMCSGKRYKHMNCGNRSINIPVIESFIWNRFFLNSDLSKEIQKLLTIGTDETLIRKLEHELEEHQKELKNLDKQRKNAITLSVKGIIDKNDIEPELRRIKSEIRDCEIKKSNVEEQLKSYDQDDLQKLSSDLKHLKYNTSFNDKQKFIKRVIKQVTIYYKDGYYSLVLEYNLWNNFKEYWHIDRNYNYVIYSMGFFQVFALNDQFKNKMTNDSMITELIADDIMSYYEKNKMLLDNKAIFIKDNIDFSNLKKCSKI